MLRRLFVAVSLKALSKRFHARRKILKIVGRIQEDGINIWARTIHYFEVSDDNT